MERSVEVAVVGGGIAGLTAAFCLSQKGASVTVFEKSASAGGRAATLSREGFFLNAGPHALFRGGAAYKFLSESGLLPAGASPKFRKVVALNRGELLEVPLSLTSLIAVNFLEMGEKLELVGILSRLKSFLNDQTECKTFTAWLDSSVKSSNVRNVLSAIVRLSSYSHEPSQLSAAAALRQIVLMSQGVVYLDYGWQSIVDNLRNACADRVQWRLAEEVSHVGTVNGDQVEVCVNGQRELFDSTILAVSPAVATSLLGGAGSENSVEAFVPARVACLDVCLSALPVADRVFSVGIDEPLYYAVHSVGGKLAPAAGAMIHLAQYLSRADTGASSRDRLLRLLDSLQPGWREYLVYERFVPSITASHSIPLPGQQSRPGGGLRVPGVYVCGDWVGQGMLADASVSSAIAAVAEIALDRKGARVGSYPLSGAPTCGTATESMPG